MPKRNHIASQVVLQNYMFERFLSRMSESAYCDEFIIKGGMLIAAIVGLDTRSTMDLDTTVKNLALTEEKVIEAIKNICSISMDDDVSFETVSIAPIRKDDRYGGFCVRLNAVYDSIVTPLSIDVSTGDVITPSAVQYEFGGLFDEEVRIKLWGYNIETVMAEKVETVLSRGIFNTRPRAISKWAKNWIEKGILIANSGTQRITEYELASKYTILKITELGFKNE